MMPIKQILSVRTGSWKLAAIAGTVILASCTSGANMPRVSTQQANAATERGYVLAVGDRLKVAVFDEPGLTGEYEIAADGALALPLIESVVAEGHTTEQVAAIVAERLAQGGYVIEPHVSVETLQQRPIYVLGEVAKPGEYAYSGKLTYLQAIAKAGGFTPRAQRSRVLLQRQTWSTGRVVELSETPLIVAPGDTLIVRESFF